MHNDNRKRRSRFLYAINAVLFRVGARRTRKLVSQSQFKNTCLWGINTLTYKPRMCKNKYTAVHFVFIFVMFIYRCMSDSIQCSYII